MSITKFHKKYLPAAHFFKKIIFGASLSIINFLFKNSVLYKNIYFKIFKIITNAPSQIYFAVEIGKEYIIVGILNFFETIKLSTCTKYLYCT